MINGLNAFFDRCARFSLAFLVVLGSSDRSCHAQLSSWIDAGGGFYESPTSWGPPIVPPATNDVYLATPGDYEIELTESHTAKSLFTLFSARPTLSASGQTYTLTGDLQIDDRASLYLRSTTGGDPFQVDVSGEVLVETSFPLLTESGILSLAEGVQMRSGAVRLASSSGHVGRLQLSGATSDWAYDGALVVGVEGHGELSIRDGATLRGLSDLLTDANVFGDNRDSSATIHVHGVGVDGLPSTLQTNSRLNIGSLGVVDMNISGGGHVSSPSTYVADDSPQTAILVHGSDAAGNPSTWSTGNMIVSLFDGAASLQIEAGAHALSKNVLLTNLADATVSGVSGIGNPTLWSIQEDFELRRGDRGAPKVLIDTDAQLKAENGLIGGSLALRSGGSATIHTNLEIRSFGELEIEGGKLVASHIDHTFGGMLSVNGEIQFNRFDGDLVNTGGTVAPGIGGTNSALVGDYLQHADGTLALEIGQPFVSNDAFTVTGIADISGQLALSLLDGFTPDSSDIISVMSTTAIVGLFDNISTGQRLRTTDGRGSFVVNYGAGSAFDPKQIVLTDFMIEALTADFNGDGQADCNDVDALVVEIVSDSNRPQFDLTGDGQVDPADLTAWLAQAGAMNLPSGGSYLLGDANLDGAVDVSDFNTWNSHKFTATAAWCSGDFNADGSVDVSDFNLWNANKFNAVSAVPEPAGASLFGWLLIALLRVLRQSHYRPT